MRLRVRIAGRMGRRLRRLVTEGGDLVVERPHEGSLLDALAEEDFDLLLLERAALGERADELVRSVRRMPGGPEVVVVASREDAAERARLLGAGCLGVLNSGLEDGALFDGLRALLARRRADVLRRLRAASPEHENRLSDFATASTPMRRLVQTARRVVASTSSILILGETGVGKEWLARAIHHEGPRADGPFVAVNCGALPEHLLESELFGHERGAFTGAIRDHRGHFETAHRGTLFLDEIGEMPAHLQVKLLRVLQDRRVQRVGGERPIDVDLRVMAATNRNPQDEIARGRLREDLFFRLAVVVLTVPPLRERLEDLPFLAATYLERFRHGLGRDVEGFAPEAMDALLRYPWPGNLREMINVIERATLLSSGPRIGLADLPDEIARTAVRAVVETAPAPPTDGRSLRAGGRREPSFRDAREEAVAAFEVAYVTDLLARSGGRVGEAAQRGQLSPRTLYALMRRHGIRKEAFRYRAS